LLVSRSALEDPRAVEEIVGLCAESDPWSAESEVRLLVPTSGRFLDRWSGDRARTLEATQDRCVLSLAALAKAGLTARADIGDENLVLAVEDELRDYPATDVILVTGDDDGGEAAQVAAELRARLRTDFLHLERAGAPAEDAPRERRYRFIP
jgi:hypothetical protein